VKTGIQIHIFLVPCFRRDGVWTPAFAGVTAFLTFYEIINLNIQPFLLVWGG